MVSRVLSKTENDDLIPIIMRKVDSLDKRVDELLSLVKVIDARVK